MGLLGEIFSSGDRMKRKLRGLLDDPMGTIALGSQRMSEDVQQMGLLADESGYLPGTNSVLLTPQQKERARKALADKGAEMAMAAALDATALKGAIAQHQSRLQSEAEDWAARKYKANTNTVNFKGDGPTKSEYMSIGSINSNRRDSNVNQRLGQINVLGQLNELAATNPGRVESMYLEAQNTARQMVARDGWNYDTALEGLLGQKFSGAKDWVSGPNSVGGALRRAIEPHITAAPATGAPDADWMAQLFGNGAPIGK